MAIVNGHGGYFFVNQTEADATNNSGDRIDIESWVGNWTCEYVAATPSGSGGGRKYLPVIGDHSWQLNFPLDASSDPTDLDILPGSVLYEVYFRRGQETDMSSEVFDLLERTTVTDVQMLDNNTDAFRIQVSGMGGVLTQGVT